ncbi:hypothetical protein ACLB0R_12365 [Sphingomonas sp. GlSt437]|uniref:hypothetical protein n=1 Tax=Sphingomonas sp. GlSt437 TaxID=3389970 RepID=UPI003A865B1F
MIGLLLPLLAASAEPGDALPPLPEWPAMAPLRYLHDPEITPAMAQFAAEEIKAGRCTLATSAEAPADPRRSLTVDVAVLVGADGMVRATVPHAINCPTVEQYAAGLVSSFTRDNLVPHGPGETWYRTSVTFRWMP